MEENKMNTGQYYFDKLPKDVQKKFKANFEEDRGNCSFENYLLREFRSHKEFIILSFTWGSSPEKRPYWLNLANAIYP